MSPPMVTSKQPDLDHAKEILARLERYAARVRALPSETPDAPRPIASPPKHPMATPTVLTVAQPDVYLPTVTKPERRPARIDPATVDLFPYDLAAAIVACAITVFAFAVFGGPVGLVAAIGLIGAGVAARQFRYFPSVGVKLLAGTLVGLVLVLMS